MPPAWAAVVVNYNAGEHLAACVDSLRADAGDDVDVVVVDNGSTDGSLAPVERSGFARVVHSSGNVGYARAANHGIATTTAPVVAVLNADIVVAPGTGKAMLDLFARDARAGVAGPRILDLEGARYPSARVVPDLGTAIGHAALSVVKPDNRWTRRYQQRDVDADAPRCADWLSGAAMWFRRDALDDIGGWDERYFMFFEDIDVCVRMREHGWHVVYEPRGCVTHVEGVSRRSHPVRSVVDHHRAALQFASRHWRGPRRLLLPFAAVALAARAAALVAVGWARRIRDRVR